MADQHVHQEHRVEFTDSDSHVCGWRLDSAGVGSFYGPHSAAAQAVAQAASTVFMHDRPITAKADDALGALAALAAVLGNSWDLSGAPAWALARVVLGL